MPAWTVPVAIYAGAKTAGIISNLLGNRRRKKQLRQYRQRQAANSLVESLTGWNMPDEEFVETPGTGEQIFGALSDAGQVAGDLYNIKQQVGDRELAKQAAAKTALGTSLDVAERLAYQTADDSLKDPRGTTNPRLLFGINTIPGQKYQQPADVTGMLDPQVRPLFAGMQKRASEDRQYELANRDSALNLRGSQRERNLRYGSATTSQSRLIAQQIGKGLAAHDQTLRPDQVRERALELRPDLTLEDLGIVQASYLEGAKNQFERDETQGAIAGRFDRSLTNTQTQTDQNQLGAFDARLDNSGIYGPALIRKFINAHNAIEIGWKQQNAVGDRAMLRSMAIMMDPATGVREEEFRSMANILGFFRQRGLDLTNLVDLKGDMLTLGGRDMVKQYANDLYDKTKADADATLDLMSRSGRRVTNADDATINDITAPYRMPARTITRRPIRR